MAGLPTRSDEIRRSEPTVSFWERLQAATGFSSKRSVIAFSFLAITLLPLTTLIRFYDLGNPLLEPHPIRQTQTALTATMFAKGKATLFDYSSPDGGKLWSFVQEFPLYQKTVSVLMLSGFSVEAASRLISLFCFVVSSFFFFRLASRWLGQEKAAWALLFFVVSPFQVILSRSCFVDGMAVMWELVSLECAFLAFSASSRAFGFCLLAMLVSGTLASVTKITAWYAPTTAIFLYTLFLMRKQNLTLFRGNLVLGSLILQLLVAILWIRWTIEVRQEEATGLGRATWEWIVGPFSSRFNPFAWWRIFNPAIRTLFQDWMVIPFLVGAFFPGPDRLFRLSCVGIALFSCLGPFNVHQYHDYYLLSEAPFLFALTGWGMVQLIAESSHKKPWALGLISVMALLFAYRSWKLPYVYGNVFIDYRKELGPQEELKLATDPNDLLYLNADSEQWWWLLYSERNIAIGNALEESNLRPTVYGFQEKTDVDYLILEDAPFLWLQSLDSKIKLFRAKGVGGFRFNPDQHFAVSSDEPKVSEIRLSIGTQFRSEECGRQKWFDIPIEGTEILILGNKFHLRLPYKRFLHLPPIDASFCPLRITIEQ